MKFTCDKQILLDACMTASKASAVKSPIASLEGLLMESENSSLKITGYNLKEGIYTTVDCDITIGGKAVLNTKLFTEILRRMPDGMASIEIDSSLKTDITCGKSSFTIMAISPDDYPELPSVENLSHISVGASTLKNMIEQTVFSIATTDIRPVYTGELFEVEDGVLTLVAVDGYRLAKRTEKIADDGSSENMKFIVPGYALTDIERICPDSDDPVSIYVGEKHLSFVIGNTVVITRRLEGDFLNYKKSIPTTFSHNIGISRSDMLASIGRVSLVIREKETSPVKMVFDDGRILMSCSTAIGKADDVCLCEGNGENLEIGFNDRYVNDALKAAGDDKLVMRMNNASSPCIIEDENGSAKFTYMILPIRLRAGY